MKIGLGIIKAIFLGLHYKMHKNRTKVITLPREITLPDIICLCDDACRKAMLHR
jgi:hypothetical protein